MKRIFALLICLSLIFVMSACAGENNDGEGNTNNGGNNGEREPIVYSEGLEFTSKGDGTCYVSGIGSCQDVNIIVPPRSPQGEKLIGIGYNAFSFNSQVRFVVLPDCVEYIDEGAFSYCSELRHIVIYDGIKSIGNFSFYGNVAFTDVYYTGSEAQWNNITMGTNNDSLANAKKHFGYFPG
jgi:hypothetical protein